MKCLSVVIKHIRTIRIINNINFDKINNECPVIEISHGRTFKYVLLYTGILVRK